MSTDLATTRPAPTTVTEQAEFARMVTSGQGQSLLPDIYRGNPANVLIAVGLGASMGLSPAESLYRISVIKGKPSAGAELIAANVRKAGHRLRVTGDETTCTATIIRADDPEFPFSVTRDLAWARGMGLAGNDNYKRQPGTMLQWRAITAVARLACPEALYGVSYTPDELGDGDRPEPPAAAASPKDALRAHLNPEQPTPEPEPTDVTDAVEMVTRPQLTKIAAAMGDLGLKDREPAIAYTRAIVGRDDIESRNDLTKAEAHTLIEALEVDIANHQKAEPTLDIPGEPS